MRQGQGSDFSRTYLFCFDGLICSGTPSGDIVIVNSTNMHILSMIKKAHLGIVTALAFSHDSRFEASILLLILSRAKFLYQNSEVSDSVDS